MRIVPLGLRSGMAIAVLAAVCLCPLASMGLLGRCHADEGPMDCCQDGQDGAKPVKHLTSPLLAPAPQVVAGGVAVLLAVDSPDSMTATAVTAGPADLYLRFSVLLI